MEKIPDFYEVHLTENFSVQLPLMTADGVSIYSFNLLGQTEWNNVAAAALFEKITQEYGKDKIDVFVTPEAKSVALVHSLSHMMNHPRAVVVRKAQKVYMQQPIVTTFVDSITTAGMQALYLGNEDAEFLRGKRVCVVDDVVSTGGTLDALLEIANSIGFTIALIACVLTEGEQRSAYKNIPILSLNHIPLPNKQL